MKNLTLVILAIIFTMNLAVAQLAESDKTDSTKPGSPKSGHAIGAVFTSTNGKGLAYRYWKNKLGVHASFIPFIDNDDRYFNSGLTLYYKLRQYNLGSLFLHGGVEYQYESNTESLLFAGPSQPNATYLVRTNGLNAGFGPGIHLVQNFVSVDFFLGYGFYTRNFTSSEPTIKPRDSFKTNVSGGLAVFLLL